MRESLRQITSLQSSLQTERTRTANLQPALRTERGHFSQPTPPSTRPTPSLDLAGLGVASPDGESYWTSRGRKATVAFMALVDTPLPSLGQSLRRQSNTKSGWH
jgi:hypothetical protein